MFKISILICLLFSMFTTKAELPKELDQFIDSHEMIGDCIFLSPKQGDKLFILANEKTTAYFYNLEKLNQKSKNEYSYSNNKFEEEPGKFFRISTTMTIKRDKNNEITSFSFSEISISKQMQSKNLITCRIKRD